MKLYRLQVPFIDHDENVAWRYKCTRKQGIHRSLLAIIGILLKEHDLILVLQIFNVYATVYRLLLEILQATDPEILHIDHDQSYYHGDEFL